MREIDMYAYRYVAIELASNGVQCICWIADCRTSSLAHPATENVITRHDDRRPQGDRFVTLALKQIKRFTALVKPSCLVQFVLHCCKSLCCLSYQQVPRCYQPPPPCGLHQCGRPGQALLCAQHALQEPAQPPASLC